MSYNQSLPLQSPYLLSLSSIMIIIFDKYASLSSCCSFHYILCNIKKNIIVTLDVISQDRNLFSHLRWYEEDINSDI